jgi:hypothetical protein
MRAWIKMLTPHPCNRVANARTDAAGLGLDVCGTKLGATVPSFPGLSANQVGLG